MVPPQASVTESERESERDQENEERSFRLSEGKLEKQEAEGNSWIILSEGDDEPGNGRLEVTDSRDEECPEEGGINFELLLTLPELIRGMR